MLALRDIGVALVCASACVCEPALAQSQPESIPTVVAQAMFLDFSGSMETPRYVVGRTPPGWPAVLVPAQVRVVGGGEAGDSSMFHVRTAVFEFSAGVDAMVRLRALVVNAGYDQPHAAAPQSGFVSSGSRGAAVAYCKGASMVAFALLDSVKSRRVAVVSIADGEAALGSCAPRDASMMMDPSHGLTIPSLSAPRGTVSMPGGSGWSGSSGEIHSTLRTTLPADSILAHYAPQLVAAGWRPEGKAAANEVIAAQQFSFRDHDEAWKGALIIMVVGERRDVVLRLSKVDAPY